MSPDGKGKTTSAVSFIKEHFNIVGNSIIFMTLLGLEKLMDLEFTCPGDEALAIVYSSVFLVVPTVIVGFVACYLSPQGMPCCKTETRENISAGDEEEVGETNMESKKSLQSLEMSDTTSQTRKAKCGCRCESIMRQFFWIKIVVYWILIVFTDGRYVDCFVKSADQFTEIRKSNISHREPLLSWREVRDNHLIHVFQIIGLLAILLVIVMVVFYESKIHSILARCGVTFESESERCKKRNEDILLQITEDTIEEEARKRQKEFVVNLLSREDWASYDPGRPNAQEELGKITAKWKTEVKRHLEVCTPPT